VLMKVLTAMALGCPVITSPAGHTGICPPTAALAAASDADSFARTTIRLLSQPEVARDMGGEARRHVAEHFGWDATVAGYLRAYGTV
jgi:polysaccharide biosynthesis protein PslH